MYCQKVYSNLKSNDGITNITNLKDYNEVYIDLYTENLFKEKYLKIYIIML